MAAFASDRRSGLVRVLVLILCALFIFAVIATPPAFALSETVALFTAASVLSAAVAALGFKLSSDAEGQATLNQMVQDFAAVSWSLGLVAVGDKVNGLIKGVQYIKMQVLNGKTYLDERIVAWCQQWLGEHGVYDSTDYVVNNDYFNSLVDGASVSISYNSFSSVLSAFSSYFSDKNIDFSVFQSIVSHYNLSLDGKIFNMSYDDSTSEYRFNVSNDVYDTGIVVKVDGYNSGKNGRSDYATVRFSNTTSSYNAKFYRSVNGVFSSGSNVVMNTVLLTPSWNLSNYSDYLYSIGSSVSISAIGNDSGLSGTDTIGADYKDKTLDQILDGLKDWAQDWYDAGADSATNTVAGAKDLPLTVGDQAASANPALNPDVVYNPPFTLPWPDVRSGETTAGTISAGQENASAAETATADVAENQTVIDSLVTWALNYIDPDTGLFSKFPLCVPYDAYLLVTSSLGADSVGSDSIFGAAPDDLNGVVIQGIEAQSDFQPIINIDHDFELDGATYPISITIDLSPWQPLITFFREGMALLLVAELIGSEYKRIRGH